MSVPLYNLTDTWTDSGTTYTAILMNVTDTASQAGSRQLAIAVGGSDKFLIYKDGGITITGGIGMNFNNASIEIGQTGVSNTPFIDWHSAAFANDYDVRLIAVGGTAVNATGSLVIDGAVFRPSGNDATSLGIAGTAWSDLFLASGGAIDFGNGNVSISHSANALAGNGVTGFVLAPGGASNECSMELRGRVGSADVTAKIWASTGSVIFMGSNTAHDLILMRNATSLLHLTATAFRSEADDGVSLGAATFGWSDLFLASGGVINFANGDMLITHATDMFTFGGATERLRIADAGHINTGARAAIAVTGSITRTGFIQELGNSDDSTSLMQMRFSNDNGGNLIGMFKSRSGTIGTNTVVTADDMIGQICAYGADGTNYVEAAKIRFFEDTAAPGTNDMPGRIEFLTTPDGSQFSAVRMTISSAGHWLPGSNDASQIGSTTLGIADLFLASGAVINFANGDTTWTHSTGFVKQKAATIFQMLSATSGQHISLITSSNTKAGGLNSAALRTDTSFVLNVEATGGVALSADIDGSGGATIIFKINNETERGRMDTNGNFAWNTAALGTTATNGWFYITTCAGVPTGVPTSFTGRVPIHYDTTNNKLYVYNGGWKGVTLA